MHIPDPKISTKIENTVKYGWMLLAKIEGNKRLIIKIKIYYNINGYIVVLFSFGNNLIIESDSLFISLPKISGKFFP